MRRTLFVVPRELVTTVVRGAGPRVAARAERELVRDVERAGLHADGAAWLRATADAVMSLLADGAPRTLAEARVAVPELAGSTPVGEGRSWQQDLAVAPRLLTVLLARGDVVRGPSAGGWMSSAPTWVSAARWLGASIPPLDPGTARHDLVRAWLGASAPATDGDLAWWLGDTLTNVRATLAAIGAIAVELDEGTGWVLPGDEEEVAPVEPWAGAPAGARSDDDGVEGSGLVPRRAPRRRCSTLPATPVRRRGGTVTSSARGTSCAVRTWRCTCSRTSVSRAAPRSTTKRRA